MELIGIVIVVLLLTLGMLFMARFSLQKDPEKKIFTRKGLATSTVAAMLETTVFDEQCVQSYAGTSKPLLRDLINDCAQNPLGELDSLYYCGGMHSCEFLGQKADGTAGGLEDEGIINKDFLGKTLGQWGKSYQFKLDVIPFKDAPEPKIGHIVDIDNCKGSKNKDAATFPIAVSGPGSAVAVLAICD